MNMQTVAVDNIESELNRLWATAPLDDFDYYQVSLLSDRDLKMYYSRISHWVGFTDGRPRREIREASIIMPNGIINRFATMNRKVLVINNEADFHFFRWITGGHAIIEKSIAEDQLKYVLDPKASIRTYDRGFVNINSVARESLNRAPNPKLRMKVLDRDKRRCKICGESPANNEHIELHLHHIIPYSKGGITDESNLITLCHTCHKGLIVHTDLSLFESIGVPSLSDRFADESFNDIQRNLAANRKRSNDYLKWISSKLQE